MTAFAQQLHSLTSQAIRGRYHGLTRDTLKIRKHIREANDTFALKMKSEGHCVAFQGASIALEDRKKQGTLIDGKKSHGPVASVPSSFPSGNGRFAGFVEQTPKNDAGPQVPSTKSLEFQALPYTSEGSLQMKDYFHHICASKPYDGFSPEELRLSDYLQEQSKPADRATRGGFGSSLSAVNANAQPSPSIFSNSLGGSGHSSNNASTSTPFGQFLGSATPAQQINHHHWSTRAEERSSRIYTWIQEEVNNSRGVELQGTLNPDVLPALFHRQIVKWKDLATSHFSMTTKTVGTALKDAIKTACESDDVVAQKIRAEVCQAQIAAEIRGLLRIRQRVDEISSRHLQTQNPLFEEQIRKARLARFTAALKRYRSMTLNSIRQDGYIADDQMVIDMRNVTALFDKIHMSNAQNLEDDIHDILKSYYELALRDFIEYVNQHVVESYLRDPDGPVLFFNPTHVSQLSQESIEELGAEDADVVAKRKGLQETLERLNRAEEIALKYT